MPLNIEARAQIEDAERAIHRVAEITGVSPREVAQDDLFFNVHRGRLLLRREQDHSELIFYSKGERKEPRPSAYFRRPVHNAELTERDLASRFGVAARVVKRRWIFEFGDGRIHIDDLGDMGSFLEIAVPAESDATLPRAYAKVRKLARAVGIPESRLVAEEYETLLRENYNSTDMSNTAKP